MTDDRTEAAKVRFYDSHNEVIRKARRVSDELDQVTLPGVPIEISEEDSIVTTTVAVLESHKEAKAG